MQTTCIIHQIKNSTKLCFLQRYKRVNEDLKAVYKANTEELALTNLDIFEDEWGKKYPMCINSWKYN